MRRIGALLASLALVAVTAGSVAAAPHSQFNGDFDVLVDGSLVGHIKAQLMSTDFTGPAGSYSFSAPDGSHGVGQVGETSFIHSPELGFDQVWFKAFEIGYSTDGSLPGYNLFVGHFVNMLDPAATDFVEFWGQHLEGEPVPWGSLALGGQYYGRFDVGGGAFVLLIRG
jgi:hypothetical protein